MDFTTQAYLLLATKYLILIRYLPKIRKQNGKIRRNPPLKRNN